MATLKQQKEWHERDIQVILAKLNMTREQYDQFAKLGKKLRKIYEDNCNGYRDDQGNWSEELEEKASLKEDKLVIQIHRLAVKLGLRVYLQTDPRGATVYLDNKEIPENNYNQAHCIY